MSGLRFQPDRRAISLAAGAAMAVALLVGCGSASTTSTATPSGTGGLGPATVPKADYVAKANAICAAGNTQIAGLGAAPGDPSAVTADQLPAWATYLSGVDSALVAEAPQLADLPRPDQGQDQAGIVLSGLATVIKDGGLAETAANGGDLAGFQAAIKTYSSDAAQASAAAAAFGLSECAK